MSNLNTLLGIVGEVPLGDRWTARRLEEFPGEAYSVWWENRGIDGRWGVVAWQVPKATAEMLIALRAAVDGREITPLVGEPNRPPDWRSKSMRILDPVIDRALTVVSGLMNEADRGIYRVDGEEVPPRVVEIIGCMLAEFFDRLSPATKPHGWTCDHTGYRFWARNDGR